MNTIRRERLHPLFQDHEGQTLDVDYAKPVPIRKFCRRILVESLL
jgi:hypothetical protein